MSRTILILLAFVCLVHSTENGYAASKPTSYELPRLGVVKDKSLVGECGCSVYRTAIDSKRDRYLFLSNVDGNAFINVDGKDVKLRLTNERNTDGSPKIGGHSWQMFTGGDIKLRVDLFVTRVCAPNDESCEVTWYRVKLTVYRGEQQTVVWAKGLCGC